MESGRFDRYISVAGAVILLIGSIIALVFFLLPNVANLLGSAPWTYSFTFASINYFILAVAPINIACAFVLIFAESSRAKLLAGVVAVMSSMVFGGAVIVTGAVICAIGGTLLYKTRVAAELGLGCIALYVGSFAARFSMFSFAVEEVIILAGLIVLCIVALDLRLSMLRTQGGVFSILALSIFWVVFALTDSSLYTQARAEGVFLTWTTLPWILMVVLTAALQGWTALGVISDSLH